MYKNIVIGVSLDTDRNIDGAIDIAQHLLDPGGRITFLHVTESIPSYVADHVPADVWTHRREDAVERVSALAARVEGAEGVVADGGAGRTITSWAQDKNADLIIVASHRPKVSDILLGSTAGWVVRHAHCAVHVVR